MTFVLDRLALVREQLDHLYEVRERVPDAAALRADLALHNDVLFALLVICQQVIDIAGELSARRGISADSYRKAIRNLGRDERFPAELVRELEGLPGFRNVLIHQDVDLDAKRAVTALRTLEAVERFVAIVRAIEAADDTTT